MDRSEVTIPPDSTNVVDDNAAVGAVDREAVPSEYGACAIEDLNSLRGEGDGERQGRIIVAIFRRGGGE